MHKQYEANITEGGFPSLNCLKCFPMKSPPLSDLNPLSEPMAGCVRSAEANKTREASGCLYALMMRRLPIPLQRLPRYCNAGFQDSPPEVGFLHETGPRSQDRTGRRMVHAPPPPGGMNDDDKFDGPVEVDETGFGAKR